MVDEPDSNRWPAACAAALPLSYRPLAEHLLPIPGIRHGSAARTGRACEPVPLWTVRAMFRIGLSSKRPIRVRCIPRAARAEASRHGACLRLRGFPCLGPACPDASGAQCVALIACADSFANAGNKNAPGCWNPRAFALPREIGVTDLRDAQGSVDGGGAGVIPQAAGLRRAVQFARTRARTAHGRWHVGCDVHGRLHGIRVVRQSPVGEGRAPYARRSRFATNSRRRRQVVRIPGRAAKKKPALRRVSFSTRTSEQQVLPPDQVRGQDDSRKARIT